MRSKAVLGAGLLMLCALARANQIDQILQDTLISVGRSEVRISMKLVPGVALADPLIATIDGNNDGVISSDEQMAYARRVLADLVVKVDGQILELAPASVAFPSLTSIKAGAGEIRVEYTATLPTQEGLRSLIFENHYQERDALYVVNCLLDASPEIMILDQRRNQTQSVYRLVYQDMGLGVVPTIDRLLTGLRQHIESTRNMLSRPRKP